MQARLVAALGVAVLVLLLGCVASTALWRLAASERDVAQGQVQSLTKSLERSQRSLRAVQGELETAARARLNLKEAEDANPGWRDARTPDAVRDSLCERIRCADVGAVRAPGS